MELEGWKQIAPYLRVTQRTAQNWARRQHMPVHHLPGAKGRVFALAAEIEAWKRTGPTPTSRSLRKAITVRLLEDDLKNLRPLIARFSSMQEFISEAVKHYGQQMKNRKWRPR